MVFLRGWGALFFLLLVVSTSAQVEINEVMYDPGQCDDSDCEWVELYNSGAEAVNLSGCRLEGKELEGVLDAGGFLVVVKDEEGFRNNFDGAEYILERSISLKNSGKEIILEGKEYCTDIFDYIPYIDFADGNNK